MLKTIAVAVGLSVVLAAPLAAQRKALTGDKVPAGQRPPAGMCRIWLEGVPAGQQPAPTDCATAVRNRPANGRVIFGDDYVNRGKKAKRSDERGDRDNGSREVDDDNERNGNNNNGNNDERDDQNNDGEHGDRQGERRADSQRDGSGRVIADSSNVWRRGTSVNAKTKKKRRP